MKVKYLVIVSLLLAVLTISAVSAAEDVMSDDVLTADEEVDVQQAPLEEEKLADSVSADDFTVHVEEQIAVNSTDPVMTVSPNEISPEGNLTVNVGDNEVPIYNEKWEGHASPGLSDLNITAVGTYRIVANFVPVSGSPINLADYVLNVTEEEGYEGLEVTINDVYVGPEESEICLVYVYVAGTVEGNISVYLDDDLCYNKSISYEDEIWLSNLNKKVKMGKYKVRVMFDDGEKVTLVKSKVATLDYGFGFFTEDIAIGGDSTCSIDLPDDATGELYVTLNGKRSKVNYKDGWATWTVSTDSLELNKTYNVSVELRNDPIYPYKVSSFEIVTVPNLLTPTYSASIGEKQVVLVDMPAKYSGTLKLFKAKPVGEDDDYQKDGDAIATANVVNGKAKVDVPSYDAEGYYYFIAEFTTGGQVYSEEFIIHVEKNMGDISASVTPEAIDVGNSVAVKITGPKNKDLTFEIYVDNVYLKGVSLENGEATLSVPFATAGEHFVKVSFDEVSAIDDDFAYSNTFKVTVKEKPAPAPAPAKQVISLTLKKVTVKKSAKKLVLAATLKINKKAVKGKKIVFKFNGKKYAAKTNKKGVAKVTIKKNVLKKLKVGKKVKIQAAYGKTTKKLTVKVKK